ncbi:MAG: beta-propeller domain-containing protein [Bacillota bacterium]
MKKYSWFPVIFVIAVIAAALQLVNPGQSEAEQLKKFASMQQMVDYIKSNSTLAGMGLSGGRAGISVGAAEGFAVNQDARQSLMKSASPAPAKESQMAKADEAYSDTNVQVEGVDEEDIIKNDGKYLYVSSAGQVHIVEAYPAESSKIVSSIKCDGRVAGIYVKENRLLVISYKSSSPGMIASVYDITDRAKPVSVRTLGWEGQYVSSRMIGNHAYLVLNIPVQFLEGIKGVEEQLSTPRITENGIPRVIQPNEIYYFDCPDFSYRYTVIVSIDVLDSKEGALFKTFLTGTSHNIYSSSENLYLTGAKIPDVRFFTDKFINGIAALTSGETAENLRVIVSSNLSPDKKMLDAEQLIEKYIGTLGYEETVVLEEKVFQLRERLSRDLERERNKTVIYKLGVSGGAVEYKCRGEVNGRLLNQFSMDEAGGFFRVATTSEGFSFTDRPSTRNNIYVMDGGLKVVGKLEGLAPRERIYSARFMGSRVYLVTFRNIDPLFVIDLKDPKSPKVLGELKIPGFSDYLHPYDENHIIGVGKEVAAVPEPQPVPMRPDNIKPMPEIMPPLPTRQQGVKIALFDVTNPEKPVEISKYVVEQQDSDSEVSRNHKAFLFSRDKNLMALPVSYSITAPYDKKNGFMPYYRQWQGMFVFNISRENGIKLKGKIEHPYEGVYEYQTTETVRRAAYINEIIYTVSDGKVRLSRIDDLKEIKTIKLPVEKDVIYYYK